MKTLQSMKSLVPINNYRLSYTPTDFHSVHVTSPSTVSLTERLVPIPDELKGLIDIGQDQSGCIPNDVAGRPVFTVLPIEPTSVLDPEPEEKQRLTSDLLLAKLNNMAASLEQTIGVSDEHHVLVTRIAAMTGTTLSVGFIVWAPPQWSSAGKLSCHFPGVAVL